MITICDDFYIFRKYMEICDDRTIDDLGGGVFQFRGAMWNADGTVTIDESKFLEGGPNDFSVAYGVPSRGVRSWQFPHVHHAPSIQGHRIVASVDAKTEGSVEDLGAAIYFRVFRSDGSRVDPADAQEVGSASQITRVKTRGDWERLYLTFDATEPGVSVVHVNFGNPNAHVEGGARTAVHHFRNPSITIVPIANAYCAPTPYLSLHHRVDGEYEFWWYPDGRAELVTYYEGVEAGQDDGDGFYRTQDIIPYKRPFDFHGDASDVESVGRPSTTLGFINCGDSGFRFYTRSSGQVTAVMVRSTGRWRA